MTAERQQEKNEPEAQELDLKRKELEEKKKGH